jgi:hypothetical protein
VCGRCNRSKAFGQAGQHKLETLLQTFSGDCGIRWTRDSMSKESATFLLTVTLPLAMEQLRVYVGAPKGTVVPAEMRALVDELLATVTPAAMHNLDPGPRSVTPAAMHNLDPEPRRSVVPAAMRAAST